MNNQTEINRLLAEIKSGSGDLVAKAEELHKLLSQPEKQDDHAPKRDEDWHNAVRLGCLVGVNNTSQEYANENASVVGSLMKLDAYRTDSPRVFRAGNTFWEHAAIARLPNHPVLWCGGDEPKELIGKHITVYFSGGKSYSLQEYEEDYLNWGCRDADSDIIGYIVHDLPELGE